LEVRPRIDNLGGLAVSILSVELAQALLEHAPAALTLHDAGGGFCAASPACARVFGRAGAALRSATLPALVAERDRDRVRDAFDAVALGGPPTSVRYRLAEDDGWVSSDLRAVSPSLALDGREVVIACASRREDVRGEDEARRLDDESDALARRHRDVLVELIPGLAWYGRVSPDLRTYKVSYFSEQLLVRTGYTRAQWVDTPGFWRSIVHPEDLERTLAQTAEMMRGERRLGAPYRLRASDGRYLWVQSSMHIERDADGTPVRMYGLTLDVTTNTELAREHAEAQRELQRSARRILELSAPLLPLGDGVLLLPLVGAVDPARSEYAFERLLCGVQEHRARRVVIDLTGVSEVDRESVLALARAVEAVRLLGARPMLTGLQPAVALAMLELDVPLRIPSFGSISAALRAP
jgi:rsbT co-antagonist protein RsbR